IYGTSCYTDGQNSDALRGKVQPQVGYFCAGSSAERVTALKPKPGWSTQVDRITAKLVFLVIRVVPDIGVKENVPDNRVEEKQVRIGRRAEIEGGITRPFPGSQARDPFRSHTTALARNPR